VDVDFPWSYDGRGRTARTTGTDHIRDLLSLLILTETGERVNRPDFGCGLRQLVFAPNSPELAAALQFTMQAAIQRELGDVLVLKEMEASSDGATLGVTVTYEVLDSGLEDTLTLTLGAQP
jgi:phage baseplate assembly protein W